MQNQIFLISQGQGLFGFLDKKRIVIHPGYSSREKAQEFIQALKALFIESPPEFSAINWQIVEVPPHMKNETYQKCALDNPPELIIQAMSHDPKNIERVYVDETGMLAFKLST